MDADAEREGGEAAETTEGGEKMGGEEIGGGATTRKTRICARLPDE